LDYDSSSIPARVLVYSTFAVVLTVGMREIAPILTILFLSIFIALIFTPIVRWLKRKGIPGSLSVLMVILLFLLIVVILGMVVAKAAAQFGDKILIYQMNLIWFMDALSNYVPSRYVPLSGDFSISSISRDIAAIMITFMTSIINGLLNAGATTGIVILTTAFLLIDTANTPEKIHSELGNQSELQMRMSKFGKSLVGFMVIRAEINLIVAISITAVLLLGKIDFAILWGVLIFMLNYIPYLGLIFATIPPTMLALFKYGPAGAIAVIVVTIIVDVLAENVVFPSLAGKGLRLSPAFLFLALIYWNYVLGPAGVLLSIPLTMGLKIILESFEETKWLARLMGPTGELEED
jgi:predicted PurR-regulated permease PerM